MKLDARVCDRARLARDARFDGRFFIAVLSTGIYCRPICPSRVALRVNVRYFPTAEEAVAAGFRPCLRCRPATAPGTPAWSGTSATVSRALRLMTQGALQKQSIASLSERLGMSSRHLNRLFQAHLGASPAAVARTWRLTLAKEGLSDPRAPMSHVAAESGFRSLRRFNDAFSKHFGRPPSDLRRMRKATGRTRSNDYETTLPFTPPYDWGSHLAFLKSRAISGLEEVVSGTYRRTFALDGKQGDLEVRFDAKASALHARIHFGDPVSLLEIVRRLRIMFDVEADPSVVARHFHDDALLGPLVSRYPGLRIPSGWDGLDAGAVPAGDANVSSGHPDAFPSHDLVLRRMAGNGRVLTAAALERLAEPWRPWRAYAAVTLWRAASARGRRSGAPDDHPIQARRIR